MPGAGRRPTRSRPVILLLVVGVALVYTLPALIGRESADKSRMALIPHGPAFLAGCGYGASYRLPISRFVAPRPRTAAVTVHAAKKISFGEEGQRKLAAGIDEVANAVRVTLGPKGRNVVLQRESYQVPHIVNDGVTIARAISLEDREMDLGAKLLTQAAARSEANEGDGTTTATILTQEMVRQGMKLVANGYNPVLMQLGMKAAAARIAHEIEKLAKPVAAGDLLDIATVSAGGDRAMGSNIAEAFERVGDTGNVIIETSQVLADEVEVTQGLTLERGYASPYFATDPQRLVAELQSPKVLVTDLKLSDAYDIIAILEELSTSKQPLLIIADGVTGDALQTLVLNKQRGILDVVAINAPSFGARRAATLQDIALATGATFISSELGMSLAGATPAQLGQCERAVVERDRSVIVGDRKRAGAVAARLKQLEQEYKTIERTSERQHVKERIASLGGGVAKIKVGGATETEVEDKKLRYDDAIRAVRSARELGIIPGGGSVLVHLVSRVFLLEDVKAGLATEDEQMGAEVVFRSLPAPMRQIATNAGADPGETMHALRVLGGELTSFGFGYNAATNTFEDLFLAGVVDPAKVVIAAVRNAASIAGMVLTTDAVVTQLPAKSPAVGLDGGMGVGMGMGGMDF